MAYDIPSQKELKELTSGERIYTGYIYEDTKIDHETRYFFARKYITKGDRVLDAACGSGYGTAILAEATDKITGVDVSEHAINFAKKNFQKESAEFLLADLSKKTPFADETFDRIVSFETIEHLPNPEGLLKEFQRILKPGGMLIVSTPDKNLVQKVDPNSKFHVHEFTKGEFVSALNKLFFIEEMFGKIPYQELSLSQKLTKFMIRCVIFVDVFRLRRRLIPSRLKAPIVQSMKPAGQNITDFYKLDVSSPDNIYVDLIAICKKK